jgi:hypothetical protein
MPCQMGWWEMCFTFIPIDQFHQSEQFLTLFQNLTTTDASSINWLHSKYSQCIDLRFLKLNIGLCSELRKAACRYIHGDSSFTAGGKIDLKNCDFTFIFCRPNLLSTRHIISKNGIYKLITSNFGIFSIISCLIYSILCHMHTHQF